MASLSGRVSWIEVSRAFASSSGSRDNTQIKPVTRASILAVALRHRCLVGDPHRVLTVLLGAQDELLPFDHVGQDLNGNSQ
jgi:hypothetical protein